MGVISDTIINRISELETQISELQLEEERITLQSDIEITREMVIEYLHHFRANSIDDDEIKRQIVSLFLNSVYLFEDHVIINANLVGFNTKKIELSELDSSICVRMVGAAGIEPARSRNHRILSPVRLPVPPRPQRV